MRSIAITALAVATACCGGSAAAGGGPGHDECRRVIVIGHRGAAGYRPEHTAAGYELAVAMGADWIEPDLVSTKDHVLIARHGNELSRTTDVAFHPEFANRKTTKVVNGHHETGWFTEDFTLAEIKTLRAVERSPRLRPAAAAFDGLYPVMTFQEVLDLAARLGRSYGRQVGVLPETKLPTYFRSLGLPLEEPLIATIKRNGLDHPGGGVVVQSFEPSSLKRISGALRVPLMQDLRASGRPYDEVAAGGATTYKHMMKPAGLARIATYARWIGAEKISAIPRTAGGTLDSPTTLVPDAHRAGLKVALYTFRSENKYLPVDLRRGHRKRDHGDVQAEYRRYLALGVDAVFADQPDDAVRARNEIVSRCGAH
ncbi:glycerophosphodiester phosphodiesterase family protein [Sinosporangium siamense]|uniref:glycerophosphodiester phosphodiesterase n=1 Tax=Sinosporangium siamense TaxID=1367973 RepID=A0A919RP53_9ACTN|nr:glycerophosphodiester phosphodiesterase family protein [Sinosporangium siamense]GII97341.1 glycerophosphoryl diester phosphodiesterase [Sinosporangium siamense]